MRHPFDLNLTDLTTLDLEIDLEFEESLTEQETEKVAGGTEVTTLALGEEGGHHDASPKRRRPKPPRPVPIDLPPVTTRALGEEGGYTTLALGEEGGESITTMALGEEGGVSHSQ